MPKKTKKQKLAAEKRKIALPQKPITPKADTVKLEEKTTSKSIQDPAQLSSSLIFKKELYKSLMISAFIILVEIGIYLAQNMGISITNFQ